MQQKTHLVYKNGLNASPAAWHPVQLGSCEETLLFVLWAQGFIVELCVHMQTPKYTTQEAQHLQTHAMMHSYTQTHEEIFEY